MFRSGNCCKKLFVLFTILFLTACAAGDAQFTEQQPADFWYGLWHGVISVVALIIQIFSDTVKVYELNNTGAWYDFGFLLGVILIWGGGTRSLQTKSEKQQQREQDWEEISDKVELKIMNKLKQWSDDEEGVEIDAEWKDIGEKVEKKLKRKIREWAEKE